MSKSLNSKGNYFDALNENTTNYYNNVRAFLTLRIIMNKFIFILISCLLTSFVSCKRITKDGTKDIVETVVKSTSNKLLTYSEKDLGKTLFKSVSVLSTDSRNYLLELLSDNPKLLIFLKTILNLSVHGIIYENIYPPTAKIQNF